MITACSAAWDVTGPAREQTMTDSLPPETPRDALLIALDTLVSLVLINLLWVVLTLPVITALPALGGLYTATNALAHQRPGDWRTFWEGFRAHFWLSWRWGLLVLTGGAVLGAGVWFYAQVQAAWAGLGYGFLLTLLVLWAIVHLFTFPLLLEQSDRRLRTALRNSLVILARRPLFTLAMSATIIVLILFSTYWFLPAWFLITGSACTYLANRTVVEAIQQFRAPGSPR